jgi:hypothetical protein
MGTTSLRARVAARDPLFEFYWINRELPRNAAPDAKSNLIDLIAVKDFLEDQFGRRVDVVPRRGLEPTIRDRVFRATETVF